MKKKLLKGSKSKKKKLKWSKKKKYVSPKAEPKMIKHPTQLAKQIYDLMKSRGIKGKYKDHVIIVGSRLVDWLGSYEIRAEDGEELKRYGVDGIALIHKRSLKYIIGEKAAAEFWKNGMRTNIGVASRRVGCVSK